MLHPIAGLIALEYSAFAVDGRPDLGFVIYNPATPADAERIRSLVKPLGADFVAEVGHETTLCAVAGFEARGAPTRPVEATLLTEENADATH